MAFSVNGNTGPHTSTPGDTSTLIDEPDAGGEVSNAALLEHLQAVQKQLGMQHTATNTAEAGHGSVFVAGWRPFVGWVSGVSLAYAAIMDPLLRFTARVVFGYGGEFPGIDTTLTLQILFGMLGLGAFRSWEKKESVARSSLKP
jgi:hypothetical protein